MPMTRHKRCCEDISSVGENEDRISILPDEIIAQILSHLSTKEAVATSILSKRWEYLWASTSNLDFSDESLLSAYQNEYDRKLKSFIFKRYVDRVIFYHGSSILQKCTMTFCTDYFSDNIYTWICALITCNIKELHLTDSSLTPQQLPWRLFTCKSLAELTIYGSFVLDLPTYVCFPSLRVLHLIRVVLVDDASTHRLLSSCPVLEDLDIARVDDCVRFFNISIPSLKRLSICSKPRDSMIEINTPSLEYFNHLVLSHTSANMLSSLIWAELDGYLNINLLNAISQVQSLVLGEFLILQLSIIHRDNTLPAFNNLKEMKLHVSNSFDWKMLLKFLKCTPNLQHLVFPSGLVRLTRDGLDFNRFNCPWFWSEFVPECLSLKVKIIEICNFVGFEEELHLVKYLLECGKVMEKLIIRRFDFSAKPGMEERMKELVDADRIMIELLSYERGSTTCGVVVAA